MPDLLTELIVPAAAARFILLANHVLSAAPVATERLKAHQGRTLCITVDGWTLPVPKPPALEVQITPAGLLEWNPEGSVAAESADLLVQVDASRPWSSLGQVAAGQMPSVRVQGDAALAADMNWILANVRWDIAADLERVVGPGVADTVTRAGAQALSAARTLWHSVAGAAGRP